MSRLRLTGCRFGLSLRSHRAVLLLLVPRAERRRHRATASLTPGHITDPPAAAIPGRAAERLLLLAQA